MTYDCPKCGYHEEGVSKTRAVHLVAAHSHDCSSDRIVDAIVAQRYGDERRSMIVDEAAPGVHVDESNGLVHLHVGGSDVFLDPLEALDVVNAILKITRDSKRKVKPL